MGRRRRRETGSENMRESLTVFRHGFLLIQTQTAPLQHEPARQEVASPPVKSGGLVVSLGFVHKNMPDG